MTVQTKLASIKSAIRVLVGIGLGVSMVGIVAIPTLAQSTRPAPLEDLQTKDGGNNIFGGRGDGQAGSVMNFIQNAIIGTPRSMDEFRAGQNENFNDAAAQFRKQQAERLRQQQQQSNPNSQVAPLPTGSTTTPRAN